MRATATPSTPYSPDSRALHRWGLRAAQASWAHPDDRVRCFFFFFLTGLAGPGLEAPKTCSEVAVCPGLRGQRAGGSRTSEPNRRPAGLAGLRDSSAREQRGPRPRDPHPRPQRLGAGEPCQPRVDGLHCFLLNPLSFLTSTSQTCQTREQQCTAAWFFSFSWTCWTVTFDGRWLAAELLTFKL